MKSNKLVFTEVPDSKIVDELTKVRWLYWLDDVIDKNVIW